jgi:hypothetical protein
MSTVPMDIDAGAVLQMTLHLFRQRMEDKKPPTQEDLDALEKAMNTYAALKCNEHIQQKGLVVAPSV